MASLKVLQTEHIEDRVNITVKLSMFFGLIKVTHKYILKNKEYYADYGKRFGIEKLNNPELSKKIDDAVDVFNLLEYAEK